MFTLAAQATNDAAQSVGRVIVRFHHRSTESFLNSEHILTLLFTQTPRTKELPKIFALQTLTPAPQDSVIHIVEMTQIARKMCLILNLVSVFCFAATICYINFGPKCQLVFHFPLSFLFLSRPTRVPVLLLPAPWHAQLQISHWQRSLSKPPVPAAALRSVRTSSPST